MVSNQELRLRGWNSLRGKYWIPFLVSLVYSVISGFGSGLTNSYSNVISSMEQSMGSNPSQELTAIFGFLVAIGVVLSLVGLAFTIFATYPLGIGHSRFYLNNSNSKADFVQLFSGFKINYWGNVKIMLLMYIKIVLWSLLFIVPGIIKTYEYAMIPYILAENPGISSADAFARSKELMSGNKWRFFTFYLSFIGWILLALLVTLVTCCIGAVSFFFLEPYISASCAEFYLQIKAEKSIL